MEIGMSTYFIAPPCPETGIHTQSSTHGFQVPEDPGRLVLRAWGPWELQSWVLGLSSLGGCRHPWPRALGARIPKSGSLHLRAWALRPWGAGARAWALRPGRMGQAMRAWASDALRAGGWRLGTRARAQKCSKTCNSHHSLIQFASKCNLIMGRLIRTTST